MAAREALALGSDGRPPVLFRGSYPLWKKRFLNWIDGQKNAKNIRKSLKEGPEIPKNPVNNEPLPNKSWNAEQKNHVEADQMSIAYLYQALPDDIYCNVDSYETGKEIWDEVEKQMDGSIVSNTIRLSTVLNMYETFKQQKGEPLNDVYIRFCNIINELRKNDVKRTNMELNIKFIKNLVEEWQVYGTQLNQQADFGNLTIHTLFEKLTLNNDQVLKAQKMKEEIVHSDPLALFAKKKSSKGSILCCLASSRFNISTCSECPYLMNIRILSGELWSIEVLNGYYKLPSSRFDCNFNFIDFSWMISSLKNFI